jgi:hypothetical protein
MTFARFCFFCAIHHIYFAWLVLLNLINFRSFKMIDVLIPCLTKKCKEQRPQLVEDEGMYCYWCPKCGERGGWAKTPNRAAYQWSAPRREGLEKYEALKRETEAKNINPSEEERRR